MWFMKLYNNLNPIYMHISPLCAGIFDWFFIAYYDPIRKFRILNVSFEFIDSKKMQMFNSIISFCIDSFKFKRTNVFFVKTSQNNYVELLDCGVVDEVNLSQDDVFNKLKKWNSLRFDVRCQTTTNAMYQNDKRFYIKIDKFHHKFVWLYRKKEHFFWYDCF